MTAQLAIVDLAALNRMEARLERLEALLSRATVTPAPEWVSICEAARIQKVSDETIRRWVREGKIESNGKAGKARKVRL